MIIVDDGSTDGTEQYIQEYIESHDAITYIYQENAGVWSARNTALRAMSKDSSYVILLDSDDELTVDCISQCLARLSLLHATGHKDSVWLYYLCEDEEGKVLGKDKVLHGNTERTFTYDDYLHGHICIEMGIMVPSSFFLTEPGLHFPEDVITEGVMRSKMWKYLEEKWMNIYLRDYVWRVYRKSQSHTEEPQITKTMSPSRCLKNAQWNEQLLAYVGQDLLDRHLPATYADYCFRIGVNYVLAWEKEKWIAFLKKSLTHDFSLRTYGILVISYFSKSLLWRLYAYYIHNE